VITLSPLGTVAPRAENFRVTVGFQFACVYYSDYSPSVAGGTVNLSSRYTRCWGENWEGQGGTDPNIQSVLQPFSSMGQADLTRVSAGGEFTCADQPDGNVGCFGSNRFGQLGVPPTVMSQSFRPVPVARSGTLHGVVSGSIHACALDANGAAWCWGDGAMGKIGVPGAYSVSIIPTAVPGGLTFRALAAGDEHTCGITTDNRVYCWGENWYGQLGTGSYYDRSNVPVPVLGT
jgi:alpha-tubulin suppressor-like RCC1 family protein